MANINELLEGHVTLEVECLDRLYLNGYLPSLATGGGLIRFLTEHWGKPIPSPARLGQITPSGVEALNRRSTAFGQYFPHSVGHSARFNFHLLATTGST